MHWPPAYASSSPAAARKPRRLCKRKKSRKTIRQNKSNQRKIRRPRSSARKSLKILDKAVTAHGGAKNLEKLGILVQSIKGTLRDMPAEQELKIRQPDSVRLTIIQTTPMGPATMRLGLRKDKGWYSQQGLVKEMNDEEIADVSGELNLRKVLTLFPLRDSEFQLKPVPGVDVEGRKTVGIRVLHKLWPAVNLYFDAKTSLLARSAGWFREANRVMMREITFSEYKPFDAVQLPTRFYETRNGSDFQKATVEYSFPTKIDDGEFDKP